MTTEEIKAAIEAAERMPENMAAYWIINDVCSLGDGCSLQDKVDYG